MNINGLVSIFSVSMLALASHACSKKDAVATSSGAAPDASLSSLPDAGGMAATNDSALLGPRPNPLYRLGLSNDPTISPHAVVGTPPLMTQLKAMADGDPGTYANSVFYGDLLQTVNDDFQADSLITPSDKASYANQFYGGTSGGPGGQGACFMAQSVGEAIGRLQQAGTSRCYMQGMSSVVSSGITVSGSIAQGDLFTQTTSNKMIKVTVTGPGGRLRGRPDGGGDMDVFIQIKGTDVVGADVYNATLHFCSGSTVTGYEIVNINKSTGVVTMSAQDQSGSGGSTSYGSSTVTASIKKLNGEYVWDTTKDRTAVTHYAGTWGIFKSNLTITSDNYIYNKMYNSFTFGGSTNSSKVYSVSEFSGSGLSSLRFLQAGFNGDFTCGNCSRSSTNEFQGGTEFVTDTYLNADNAFKTAAATVDLDSDSFFTSNLGNPTIDLSAFSCAVTPDANVTMDFSDPNVAAIQTNCESQRFNDYDMCNQTAIQTIEGYLH